jgi:ferritin-like metal-binding protein YciE
MPMKNLEELFINELKDIYDAERRITKALPKMMKAASHDELRSAFEEHLERTEEHIARLDRIFESLDVTPGRKTCQGMVGLLEEGEELMKEDGSESVRDAALIAAAQKVEHYEMATYGCLRDWAQLLDNNQVAKILQQTLDEEGEADKKLTEIAQSLNVEAAESDDEEEEDTVATARRSSPSSRSAGSRPRSR